jgi:hypothetical protein
MFDGHFLFKNAQLHKIIIKSVSYQRKGAEYSYSFGRNDRGAFIICKLDAILHQPTNTLDMVKFLDTIVDNEFCTTYIEPSGNLVLKIKKKYRFNPFLVLDSEYIKEWGRLFNGLSYTMSLLDRKSTLHGGVSYKPDPNLVAAYVLDAMFQKLIDPDNKVYLEILTRNVLRDDVEAFTIKGIAASCLFQVTLKNVMTVIRGMYAKP